MSYTKHYLTIAALMMLLLAAAIVTNPINLAIAQQPTTATTNQSDINVDQKIDELKAKFPELNSSPQGNEVKDLIQKVLSLDKEQALKVLAAFHILRNLQEYKEISSGGTNSTG